MSRKKVLTVEDLEKALNIEINPREQVKLKEMGWEGMIRKAMTYNPNIKHKKKGKK